jgi:hypothetical protein
MKNIHVLSTKGLSRLVKGETTGRLLLHDIYGTSTDRNETQNICITSNEKFVRDEYVTDGIEVIRATPKLVDAQGLVDRRDWRKIILTTDQELNKDGVQAIDDEFLEWFVKNPSCEEVETFKVWWSDDSYSYEIIIPKEDWLLNNPQCKQIESCNKSLSKKCICPKEDEEVGFMSKELDIEKERSLKQETLGGAAEKYAKKTYRMFNETELEYPIEDFIKGAKWQQERMYSEEEVVELCKQFATFIQQKRPSYKKQLEWFEQFKK